MIDALRYFLARLLARRSEPASAPNPRAPLPGDSAHFADYRRSFDSAMTAFRAGKYGEAAAGFEDCIDVRHDDADAHLNLGLAYYRLGRREEAADSFALALCHRKDFAEAHFNLGLVDLERGAYERAARAFEEAIR